MEVFKYERLEEVSIIQLQMLKQSWNTKLCSGEETFLEN